MGTFQSVTTKEFLQLPINHDKAFVRRGSYTPVVKIYFLRNLLCGKALRYYELLGAENGLTTATSPPSIFGREWPMISSPKIRSQSIIGTWCAWHTRVTRWSCVSTPIYSRKLKTTFQCSLGLIKPIISPRNSSTRFCYKRFQTSGTIRPWWLD